MATAVRAVVAVVVLLAARGAASAQLPVAPPPHPTLDELVKEYQQWGLPVPSPDAQLVRLKRYREIPDDPSRVWLAFRNLPVSPGEPPRHQTGDEWMFIDSLVEDAVLTMPVGTDLEHVDMLAQDRLRFTVAFHLRGWDDAAKAAYTLGRKCIAEDKVDDGEEEPTVLNTVRGFAISYWHGQLLARHSDRHVVLKHLRELIHLEPHFLSPRLEWTLKDLEATLAPRKPKPGAVESLIDELTDYWENDETGERNDAAYWKLAALGFDAVPVLIEHLTDRRLTRAQFGGFNNSRPYIYRVNHLISRLLVELSGGQLNNFEERGDTIDPSGALKWWGKTREIAEERWLLDHALPERTNAARVWPSSVVLRAIRAKYPQQLGAIYRAILLNRTDVDSERITAEVAASTLPRERKMELLEEGAVHRDFAHRVRAMRALAKIDGAAFRKHYVRTVEALPANLPPDVRGEENEIDFLGLVCETNDRGCWNALLAVTRRATPADRLRVVGYLGWSLLSERTAPGYREGVRYLFSFRDDMATGVLNGEQETVGDRVAVALAFLLGVERPLVFDLPSSPRERSLFRARVRELAELELASPTK